MANNYKKVYLHIVFAVRNRKALLDKSWRPKLFANTSAIIKNRGHYPLAVNGYLDHVHIFIDYSLNDPISDFVREIKKGMTNFIKENNLTTTKFEWQSGYAVFSHGYKEKKVIIEYIKNQELHHQNRSFQDEYLSLLQKFEIDFEKEYLFEFFQYNR